MVISAFKATVVGAILTTIFCCNGVAQTGNEYYELNKYSKFGLVGGVSLYNRAEIYSKYGDYTFENKPTWSYNAGLEYDFFPNKKWSVLTGLLVALEPSFNIKYRIFQKDLYPGIEGDLDDKLKSYAINTFSMPILLRLNLRTGNNSFANFLIGLKTMYFPKGSSEYGISISDTSLRESKEIFGLRLESQDNSIYSSFVIGTGFSYAFKGVLLKSNLIYVMNFQNTMEGEYLFDNLLTSPRSRGDYKLSGNYVSLMVTASLNKKYNFIKVVK